VIRVAIPLARGGLFAMDLVKCVHSEIKIFTKLKQPLSPKNKTNPRHFLFARSLFVPPFEHSSKAKTTNEVGGKALP